VVSRALIDRGWRDGGQKEREKVEKVASEADGSVLRRAKVPLVWQFMWTHSSKWFPHSASGFQRSTNSNSGYSLANHQIINHFSNFEGAFGSKCALEHLSRPMPGDDDQPDTADSRRWVPWLVCVHGVTAAADALRYCPPALEAALALADEEAVAAYSCEASGDSCSVDADDDDATLAAARLAILTHLATTRPTPFPHAFTPSATCDTDLFFVKPQVGARGVGIQVAQGFFDAMVIAATYGEPAAAEDGGNGGNGGGGAVVQRGVTSPLVSPDGRKMDLRQFALVSSLDPLTVLVHDQAYARLASLPLTLDPSSLSVARVHLTNYQVNRPGGVHAPARQGEDERRKADAAPDANSTAAPAQELVWSLDKYRDFLAARGRRVDERRRAFVGDRDRDGDASGAGGGAACRDPVYCPPPPPPPSSTVYSRLIKPQLHSAIASIVQAWPDRRQNHRFNSFELLGFDVLVDRTYTCHIIEVNINSGLHLLTSTVEAHHSAVINDTIALVVDRWEAQREAQREGRAFEGIEMSPGDRYGGWTVVYVEGKGEL